MHISAHGFWQMRKQFAVIGNPIEQSRSPELHHAFAEKTGIDLQYSKRLVPLDDFSDSVADFFSQGGVGMNVTVPFKEQAFAQCGVLTERAKIAKAVNTLWMQDGVLHGDNTDGQGLVDAIRALGWNLEHSDILIIGAGGATRGVIYPLVQAGAKKIVIANRTLARAEQLVADLQAAVPQAKLQAMALTDLTGQFDLAINATSASLTGDALTCLSVCNLILPMKWRMANRPAFWNKPKPVAYPPQKVLACWSGKRLSLFISGMASNLN